MARPLPPTAARARIMSAIRGRGNKTTEVALAQLLRGHGLGGWRRHQRLPGTPDFVFRKGKVAVFIDGCFWHGCPWCYKAPSRNSAFWRTKVLGNKARDRRVNTQLRELGWHVLRLWEHELKKPEKAVAKLRRALGDELVREARRKQQA
jgi:DNA mismatch endonuclease, patch repair protein